MKYLNNLSEEEQIKVIKKDPYDIRYIKNPSEALQLAAVQENGYAIEYIKNSSKDIVITAMLKLIQKGNYDYAIKLLKKYDNNNWPELDVIKTSLRADGKIK